MSDNTAIEWTDATWNPITGCSVISPGCTNCYAMKLAGTRLRHTPSRAGLTSDSKAGPVWNGQVRFNEPWLTQPLHWKKPRKIFVCAHGDLFHENVPDAWIDKVFAVMVLAPQHQFQVLTKRAERMREYLRACGAILGRQTELRAAVEHLAGGRDAPGVSETWIKVSGSVAAQTWQPLPNVWLGVSVEDQQRANERIPHLLATPAAIRFISAEPLLGALTIFDLDGPIDLPDGAPSPLHWVITGGESGPGARPMRPDWARSLRDQCAAAGVPFFFKQWGEWAPQTAEQLSQLKPSTERRNLCGEASRSFVYRIGKKAAGNTLDGRQYLEFPR